jgi:hypothetical protein
VATSTGGALPVHPPTTTIPPPPTVPPLGPVPTSVANTPSTQAIAPTGIPVPRVP